MITKGEYYQKQLKEFNEDLEEKYTEGVEEPNEEYNDLPYTRSEYIEFFKPKPPINPSEPRFLSKEEYYQKQLKEFNEVLEEAYPEGADKPSEEYNHLHYTRSEFIEEYKPKQPSEIKNFSEYDPSEDEEYLAYIWADEHGDKLWDGIINACEDWETIHQLEKGEYFNKLNNKEEQEKYINLMIGMLRGHSYHTKKFGWIKLSKNDDIDELMKLE